MKRPCVCDRFDRQSEKWLDQPKGSCKQCFAFHFFPDFKKAWSTAPINIEAQIPTVLERPCKFQGHIIPVKKIPLGLSTEKTWHECEAGFGLHCVCECNANRSGYVPDNSDDEEEPIVCVPKTPGLPSLLNLNGPAVNNEFLNPRNYTEEAVLADIRGPEKPRPLGWQRLAGVQAAHKRLARETLEKLPSYPEGNRKGAGIILIGGGKYDCGNYIHGMMVRELGCTLPIQLWHRGDAEPVSAMTRSVPGLTVMDAEKHPLRKTWRVLGCHGGWDTKMIAGINSGYEKWIYSDSDNYPVVDPTPLIHLLDDHPAILYPDVEGMWGILKWDSYDLKPSGKPSVQGGVYAINLRTAWRAVNMIRHFDDHAEYWYAHEMGVGGFGDQDQIRAAFPYSDTPFLMMGNAPIDKGGTLVQCEPTGREAWYHRIAAKPAPIGMFSTPFVPRMDFALEKLVWKFFTQYTGVPCLSC